MRLTWPFLTKETLIELPRCGTLSSASRLVANRYGKEDLADLVARETQKRSGGKLYANQGKDDGSQMEFPFEGLPSVRQYVWVIRDGRPDWVTAAEATLDELVAYEQEFQRFHRRANVNSLRREQELERLRIEAIAAGFDPAVATVADLAAYRFKDLVCDDCGDHWSVDNPIQRGHFVAIEKGGGDGSTRDQCMRCNNKQGKKSA
jgi:hypothetical protein